MRCSLQLKKNINTTKITLFRPGDCAESVGPETETLHRHLTSPSSSILLRTLTHRLNPLGGSNALLYSSKATPAEPRKRTQQGGNFHCAKSTRRILDVSSSIPNWLEMGVFFLPLFFFYFCKIPRDEAVTPRNLNGSLNRGRPHFLPV